MSNSSTEGQATGTTTEGQTTTEGTEATNDGKVTTFTQEDVNRIVGEAKRAERSKFADYNDLKAKAEGVKSVEQQLAEIQAQNKALARDALASKIAAKHKISSEDADLFLTGADEDTLNAQAERLAAHLKATTKEETSSSRRPGAIHAPLEGRNPKGSGASEERNAVRALFGGNE